MKNRKLFLPILVLVLAASLSNSCYKTIKLARPLPAPCDCDVLEATTDETVIRDESVIKIYADTHIYGGHRLVRGMQESIQENIDYFYPALPSLRERTFYLGDIVDFKNAPDPERARQLIDVIRKAAGGNYVRGNHEMDTFGDAGTERHTIYKGTVLLLHGHTLRYNEARAKYWESGRKMQASAEDMKYARSTDQVFAEAARLAVELGCKMVVFGHTHPDSLEQREVDGIRVVNVPKGCTYLHVPLP